MMEESLEAILAPVHLRRSRSTAETDWFTINDGRLQMRPYTYPHPEVAVIAMVTPSSRASPGSTAYPCSPCRCRWPRASRPSAKRGAWCRSRRPSTASPSHDHRTWRILGNMHVAETHEQAVQDAAYGLKDFSDYFGGGAGFVPLANKVEGEPDT